MPSRGDGTFTVTVLLRCNHLAELDRWRVHVRLEHRVDISRSAIIRALIDLAETKDRTKARRRGR